MCHGVHAHVSAPCHRYLHLLSLSISLSLSLSISIFMLMAMLMSMLIARSMRRHMCPIRQPAV